METGTTRETRVIKVGSHEIVCKSYLTGREVREIENQMLNQLEMNQKNGQPEISGFKASMMRQQEDQYLTSVVVSLDGNAEDILNRLLDLPGPTYKLVVETVKEIVEKKEVAAS